MDKIFLIILFFVHLISFAQDNDWKNHINEEKVIVNEEGDEELDVVLDEMYISVTPEEKERLKNIYILKRRIQRVYPYAVATADNLTVLNKNLAKMETEEQKEKYIERAEGYLTKNFEERLKKLSMKDGQILVKLIYRQTGISTYDLIKKFKSGWSAWWSNQFAGLFNIDLKRKYNPDTVFEDYYIEMILDEFKKQRKIDYRAPYFSISIEQLKQNWDSKLGIPDSY